MTDVEEAIPMEQPSNIEQDDEQISGTKMVEKEEKEKGEMRAKFIMMLKVVSLLILICYILAALIIDIRRAKFLLVCTILIVIYTISNYFSLVKYPEQFDSLEKNVINFIEKAEKDMKLGGSIVFLMVIIMIILAAVSIRNAKNLISLLGLIVFILLSWMLSYKPKEVRWRPVIGSLFVQYIFGYCVIKTQWGLSVMEFLSKYATILLNFTYAGSSFVYGFLVDGSLFGRPFALASGEAYFLAPPLFFNVLNIVVFFSSLISISYHLRIIPFVVKTVGYFISIVMGTSASESLSAAGNIFIGQTEAPLIVKPFIEEMTASEIHAVMTGGFATIAGSVFGVYVSFGVEPTALLAASLMSAPAALAISKLTYPETEESKTDYKLKKSWIIPESDSENVVHAASVGAVTGSMLMLNIAANLVSTLAVIAMLDSWLLYFGGLIDIYLSFNTICEIIFYPFVWLMGVENGDLRIAATLIGYKIFANEFVAYELLAFQYKDQLSARSYYILSYALCGFSNFGSIGIQLGGITPLAPSKGPILSKLALSAMIAGNTACFMTACIAGLFYEEVELP